MRDPVVGIVMGSDSDWPVMEPAARALEEFGVPYEAHVVSAHRTPRRMLDYAEGAAGRGLRVIIAGAGERPTCRAWSPRPPRSRSSASPVPGPPGRDGQPAPIVQMPAGVPVATVGIDGGRNAGLLAVRVLAASDDSLRDAVVRFQAALAEQVAARDLTLQERLASAD
ncbi:AIR carboxylase family protein [Blastococcus brunescens]|uniref:N5-carboxyaminoimidazole ribonucleotide mutase n=1 Tax=Blastococcus brunescens TaxID=1564165 RepID=A0ABZ1AWG3_9ACTN|nr:AIR carboxylase family protein [Blastococcus sp. BMG 8361]WRL62908.1 AIR carboxylase family protein [Blastococcus sp. BMG 8361]